MTVWATFLNAEISRSRLNHRVWTMNNHFTTYHMSDLIRHQGPLRYYSCRSLERTIQKFSNLSKSKSRPDRETENILRRLNFFKQFQVQMLQESILPARLEPSDRFLDYPGDINHVLPQLWAKFRTVNIELENVLFDIPKDKIVLALRRFYARNQIRVRGSDVVQIQLAARMYHNGLVHQSKYYRSYNPQLKRANNLVVFLSTESGQ